MAKKMQSYSLQISLFLQSTPIESEVAISIPLCGIEPAPATTRGE
ncbi:MAG: hypothetical protein ACYCY0_05315 [Acidithiobacillus ferrivorans]